MIYYHLKENIYLTTLNFACCQAKTKNMGKWISILLNDSVFSQIFSVKVLNIQCFYCQTVKRKKKKGVKSRQYNKICYRLKNQRVREV